MPRTVAEIMVNNVVAIRPEDSLLLARMTLRDRGIRHLPVVADRGNRYLGVISQRHILARDIAIIREYGFDDLERIESRLPVSEVMDREAACVAPETELTVAARHFLEHKNGCLPVVVEGCLVGILTPIDFVRLSLSFLEAETTGAPGADSR